MTIFDIFELLKIIHDAGVLLLKARLGDIESQAILTHLQWNLFVINM